MYLPTIFLILAIGFIDAKVYDRCELAREIKSKGMGDNLATWVCVAFRESSYDTFAHNTDTGDFGIFQISQIYWCSADGVGNGCNVHCADLLSDDITQSISCALKVFQSTAAINGNGFSAWVGYNNHCAHEDVNSYIAGCGV